MRREIARGEVKKLGSGAYDIDILNVMGRQQKKARNQLYSEAIANPTLYLDKRSEAESTIIDNEVERQYKFFKLLLLKGQDEDEKQICVYPSGEPYAPNLPEATITKFAIRASETLEKIYEDAIEEIFPMKYGDLAHKKSAEIAKAVEGV